MAERKNLNEATKEELERVEGIGPRRAELIRELCDQRGGIHDWEELKEVQGFDEGWVQQLQQEFEVR